MDRKPYQLKGVTEEVLEALLESIVSIHEGVDAIYAPHVVFSACFEYQRAKYIEGSYDLDKENEKGERLIDKGILETGFNDESQVTPVVFHILEETSDIEVLLYQVSQKLEFDGDFGAKHLAFMAEIVRQSRTIFGGGNAMGNLISGYATLEYILKRTNKNKEEIFVDPALILFAYSVRCEIAHNPWGLHEGGQIEPFDMDDVYLGAMSLHRLYYELGHAIYGNDLSEVVNLEPFNYDLDKIEEAQDSLGWVYHEDEDSEGWNKTEI